MGIRLAEQYSVDVVLNCHSWESEVQLINPSSFGHPAHVAGAQRAVWGGLSFALLLEVNYVTVEFLLKDGQREPLAMRRQLLS